MKATCFVLDYLRDGPARLEDLYRDARLQFDFSQEDVADAEFISAFSARS